MDVLATLENIFRSKGYKVLLSSEENRYLLLSKDGSTMAVGHAITGSGMTEGEAEMFVSMGQNDSAGSLLFISPQRLSRSVKAVFEKEQVSIWDRTSLVTAIGDHILAKWDKQAAGGKIRLAMDMVQTPALGGADEVREFHREINQTEVGGFKVTEVELNSHLAPEPGVPVEPTPEKKVSEPVLTTNRPEAVPDPEPILMDMPMFDIETRPEKPVKEKVEEKPKTSHRQNVPEDILMDPWAGFEGRDSPKKSIETPPQKETQKPVMDAPPRVENAWKGSTLVPLKFTETDALSLAGVGEEAGLRRENRPFLLLEASYLMVPEDGTPSVEQDGTYLYDCLKAEVTDIPSSIYDEIAELVEKWDGSDGPKTLTNIKEDHNNAMTVLRTRIGSEKMAKDRKVRETLMSTIYREINFHFDPRSLKLISSRRVMVPYWVKDGNRGKVDWDVNGFLGQLTK